MARLINTLGPSPIRLVNDIGPVKGADNNDLMCGLSAQKAEMVVPANPGSKVSFQWVGGGGNNVYKVVFGKVDTILKFL